MCTRCSLLYHYNSHNMEATQASTHRGLDKQVAVHIYYEILFSHMVPTKQAMVHCILLCFESPLLPLLTPAGENGHQGNGDLSPRPQGTEFCQQTN